MLRKRIYCAVALLGSLAILSTGTRLRAQEAAAPNESAPQKAATSETPQVTREQALADLAKHTTEVKTWTADYVMLATVQGMGVTTEGRLEVRGTQVRNEMKMDLMGQSADMMNVVDDQGVMWMESNLMGQHMVMKMDMKKVGGLPGAESMGGLNPMPSETTIDPTMLAKALMQNEDVKFLGQQELDGAPVYAFEMPLDDELKQKMDAGGQLEQSGIKPESIQIMLALSDGFPRLWQVMDTGGKAVYSMIYRNVQLNPEIPAERFAYTPPADAHVMDMTSMAAGMMQQQGGGGIGLPREAGPAGGEKSKKPPKYNQKFKAGDLAPLFVGNDLQGNQQNLVAYRGKVVLIDFWATWSDPYMQTLPDLVAAAKKYHGDKFAVIGVSLDEEKQPVTDFLAKHPEIDWPQIFDGKGWSNEVAKRYAIEAIPHTVLIDAEGVIYKTGLTGAELDQAIDELLKR